MTDPSVPSSRRLVVTVRRRFARGLPTVMTLAFPLAADAAGPVDERMFAAFATRAAVERAGRVAGADDLVAEASWLDGEDA